MAGSAPELVLLMVVLLDIRNSSRAVDVLAVDLREKERATNALEVFVLLTAGS